MSVHLEIHNVEIGKNSQFVDLCVKCIRALSIVSTIEGVTAHFLEDPLFRVVFTWQGLEFALGYPYNPPTFIFMGSDLMNLYPHDCSGDGVPAARVLAALCDKKFAKEAQELCEGAIIFP